MEKIVYALGFLTVSIWVTRRCWMPAAALPGKEGQGPVR